MQIFCQILCIMCIQSGCEASRRRNHVAGGTGMVPAKGGRVEPRQEQNLTRWVKLLRVSEPDAKQDPR